jgi:hypothetical protein
VTRKSLPFSMIFIDELIFDTSMFDTSTNIK